MAQKASLRLLVLFLGFSYVVSTAAVPTTRSLKSNKEDLLPQDAIDLMDGEDMLDVGEGSIEGRMDWETVDYKDAGPNPAHNPKPPGRT